jgi:TonB family protein
VRQADRDDLHDWDALLIVRRLGFAFVALVACLQGAPRARAETPEGDAPAPAGKLTKPPRLVKFVSADYPPARKQAGEEATVVLRLTVAADGTVPDTTVETSAGADFDAAAIAAARQFVFEPAEIDGTPAAIRLLYKYAFVIKREERTTGDLTGVVRNRKNKQPLAGITLSAGRKSAVTGDEGRFALPDLPPGKQAVSLSGPEITALRTEETLEAGKKTDVVYDVTLDEKTAPEDKDDLEIVVVAPPLQKAIASVTVAADQGRRVPGTQGDVLKVVESMPGVGRAAAGSGQVVVWGAAPQDTRVFVDGVPLPTLYHAGGFRSVLAGDLVGSIDLVPGGYGASYGRGLGGVIVVASAPQEGPGTHGALQADVIDAAAMLRTAITPRIHAAAALRGSYLDRSFDLVSDRDVGDLFPIPKYRDGQLQLSAQLPDDARLDLVDEIARTVTTSDPSFTKRDDRDTFFYRTWARYHRTYKEAAVADAVVYFGGNHAGLVNQFGGPETSQSQDDRLWGFRGSWRGAIGGGVALTLGIDAEAMTSRMHRAGAVTLPAREGDPRAFGQLPPDEINFDDWTALRASAAPYGQLDFGFAGDRIHVVPGLRIEPYVTSASRRSPADGTTPSVGVTDERVAVQPRLSARAAVTGRLTLTASWGIYYQPPAAEDLSPVFGNPTLPLARAVHYVAGAAVRLTDTLSAELTVFRTTSSSLAARSPLDTPLVAQALVPFGEGRVVGGQVTVRQQLAARFFGWISYSLLRSERRDPIVVDAGASGAAAPTFAPGPARLFDFDQTHILTAVGSYDLGRGFEIGVRLRYATGFPRTPVVDSVPDLRRGPDQPVFGPVNSIRLPSFFQGDLRVAKRLRIDRGTLEIYLDIQNVSNRANAEEFAYSADYRTRYEITGLPILPVLGARYAW